MKKKFKEILKLKKMLQDEDIPFTFEKNYLNRDSSDSFEIVIKKNNIQLCSACQHSTSYGHEKDLIEIFGGLTKEEHNESPMLGYLKAEEVFKRFKWCYTNNTPKYYKTNS
jgi:hypothetical protein